MTSIEDFINGKTQIDNLSERIETICNNVDNVDRVISHQSTEIGILNARVSQAEHKISKLCTLGVLICIAQILYKIAN
jgi:peptidoglycan hydrolase CwlO-like protein